MGDLCVIRSDSPDKAGGLHNFQIAKSTKQKSRHTEIEKTTKIIQIDLKTAGPMFSAAASPRLKT